jgi:hypothetical protein
MKGGPPNVGLGECAKNLENGNACFGSVGETCKTSLECAQVVDERTPWGTDETPMQPVQLTCGRDLKAQAGVLRTPEDTAQWAIVDVRCAFGDFSSACSLDPNSLVDCSKKKHPCNPRGLETFWDVHHKLRGPEHVQVHGEVAAVRGVVDGRFGDGL